MLPPTLLAQSRTPARTVTRDAALRKLLLKKNWEQRVTEESRPDRTAQEPLKDNFGARRGFAMKRGATFDPDQGQRILERIIKGNDLVPVNYLERGVSCSRAVCRIRLMNSNRLTVGFATGFMVARGVLLTNQHVFPTAAHARFARVEFGYEHDHLGGDRVPDVFDLNLHTRPIIRGELDFALVAVAPRSIDGSSSIDDYGWLVLDPTPGKTRTNEYLTIIQHPSGERKQICVRENKLIRYLDDTIWYQTDTVAGSSGSPVFNNSWQVVALHHSGVPVTNGDGQIMTTDDKPFDAATMKESEIAWKGNEGIRVSSILDCLREEHAEDHLAQAVLAGTPCAMERSSRADGFPGASVTVPVYVSGPAAAAPFKRESAIGPFAEPSPLLAGFALEVKAKAFGAIIKYPSRTGDDLSDRKGYQSDFLGDGPLSVPTPKIAKNHSFNTPMTWGPGNQKTILPYTRHSVLLSDERRLAIWAAVNVDDNLRHSQPTTGDPTWINDPRLNGRDVGDEFYKTKPGVTITGQGTRKSPFDRGHQVQQEDATWGKNASAAGQASIDTFYFANAAPQIIEFNQRGNAWQGLEDYCIEVFAAKTRKACVISGPIFDAPRTTTAFKAGTLALPLDPKGARTDDPKILGVRVPKAFYKIVVCTDGQHLRAAAFLMSQQNQLDRLKGTPIVDLQETLTTEQARIFFVKVEDVSALTGLDFGVNVRNAQSNTLEALRLGAGSPVGTEVQSLADLRL